MATLSHLLDWILLPPRLYPKSIDFLSPTSPLLFCSQSLINQMMPRFLLPSLPLLIFFLLFVKPSLSDPRATEAALVCSNRTAPLPERPTFVSNFVAALEDSSRQIISQRYSAVVKGSGNATVYAFGECMRDLDGADCNFCFAQCKTQILRCLPYQTATRGGRLFYDGCYLRYDDYNFLNETLSSQDLTVCASRNVTSDPSVFLANVLALARNLSEQAPRNDGFLVGSVNLGNASVFGLAQCWEFVNGSDCGACLADAVSKIGACPPKKEGRVLNAGCYMRYSTERFYYNNTGPPPVRSSGHRKLAIILAVTSSVVASALMIGTAVFFVNMRIVRRRRERKQLGALLDIVNSSKINFSYESLEKATDYFHLSNKLGQGGSGTVYKGTLPDGRVVAVKRLLFNTRQWVDHFFNEVNLISGIRHKNLVQLLGCSITGPESLLVYEYVPNQSLNDHLFVKDVSLSWELRNKIILGIAEGLAYLHGESQLRIIHRDIKLTNILLDKDFTPKIADFGLARLFPEDKTHVSTAIAGTLGYMAPEYVVCGKLTEKADVYSFGVLVIEVITGKRNKCLPQGSVCLLHKVWNDYQTDKLVEVIDPVLKDSYLEEASRLLQIGLLCVQATVELRPSMSKVVTILRSNDCRIPEPTQPPFLSQSSSGASRSFSSRVYASESHSQSRVKGTEGEHLLDRE